MSITATSYSVRKEPSLQQERPLSTSLRSQAETLYKMSRSLIQATYSAHEDLNKAELPLRQISHLVSPDTVPVLMSESLQIYENALRKSREERNHIADSFVKSFLGPEDRPLFYLRIEKMWHHFTGEKVSRGFGQRLLKEDPSHIVIHKAIEEELLMRLTKDLLPLMKKDPPVGMDAEAFQLLDRWLAETDLSHFSERGAISCLMEHGGANLSLFDELFAQITGVKNPCNPELSLALCLSPTCDENMRGVIFTIMDAEGVCRGHLLGSVHWLPLEALKFRQKIRKEFSLSTTVFLEKNALGNIDRDRLQHGLGPDPKTKKRYASMDWLLLLQAVETGKRVIGLEDSDPTKEEDTAQPKNLTDEVCEKLSVLYAEMIATGNLGKLPQATELIDSLLDEKGRAQNSALTVKRNKLQCDTLSHFLSSHPRERVFAVVGASHLLDYKDYKGLPTLLEQQGFRTEQIL